MTEQQAIQKMKEDLKLRGLAEGTFKNCARNVRNMLGADFDLCLCCGIGHFTRDPPDKATA